MYESDVCCRFLNCNRSSPFRGDTDKKKKKKNLVCVEAEESLSETLVPST